MASSSVIPGTTKPADPPPGFWDGYWKSLKPRDVEEPIDVWVHRPLAYVLARALMPTPVSPNLVTLVSILFGIAGGVSFAWSFPWHMQIGGLCIFLSAIFDCADGQLARMRGTSSAFGRMLDGAADLVVSLAAVGGAIWVIWSRYNEPTWLGLIVLALCVATAVTGSFHTGMYDHYKNVYLRLTSTFSEGEDYDAAIQRYRAKRDHGGLLAKIAWYPYLFYVKSQADYLRKFDPFTTSRLSSLPAMSAETARVYRQHAGHAMRVWRTWFGFGSLVFGIALFSALDVLEYYMLARLVLQNAVFYGYLRPRQRKASQAAMAELGVS